MWTGEMTEEMETLFRQYREKFSVGDPDEYDELNYNAMTYDQFVGFIKECLATGKEMPDVVP